MKAAFAVLALLCLSSAVSASEQKLPLSHLLVNNGGNVTLSDIIPPLPNVGDIHAMLAALPKFQMPAVNVTGLHPFAMMHGNTSVLSLPLVSLAGAKAAMKAVPLAQILGSLHNGTTLGLNLAMPSLPAKNISVGVPAQAINIDVSQLAVPLHALLGAGKALRSVPVNHLMALVNATQGIQVPKLPALNVSQVGVPLNTLLGLKFKGLPLLAHLAGGNVSLTMPVFNIPKPSVNVSMGEATPVGALPLQALLGLKALPLGMLAQRGAGLMALLKNGTDINMLAGLTKAVNVSGLPMGHLAALTKSFNVSGLPLGALAGLKAHGMFNGTMMAGPSIGINVVPGSIGTKNVALNIPHPTLGLKNLALALNLTVPELAMKLAALNVSVPMPSVGLGASRVNLTLPVPSVGAAMGSATFNVPTAAVTMPSVSVDTNSTGNSTGKVITLTKPGLSVGSANVTVPTITPQLAMKLAQLGLTIPTPQIGMRSANVGATLPMPDLKLRQHAVNMNLTVPSVGMGSMGVNMTVPSIQLPRLALNVTGMPQLNLDGLKTATLLSWLKDAGFFQASAGTDGNATVINLAHPKGL